MRKLNRDKFINIFANACVVALVLIVLAVTLVKPIAYQSSSFVSPPYYNGDESKKQISLMVNVYENSEVVNGMLDTFANYGVKATFFVGGCWAVDNEQTVKRIVGEGHEIANHGYFHKNHDKLDYELNKQEIYFTEIVVQTLCGQKTTLFAPPSGAFSKTTLQVCEDLGYKVIMWSKDTIDWRDSDINLIYKRATQNIENGDLILMHPKRHTLTVLPKILDKFKAENFSVVTVSDNIQGVNL